MNALRMAFLALLAVVCWAVILAPIYMRGVPGP